MNRHLVASLVLAAVGLAPAARANDLDSREEALRARRAELQQELSAIQAELQQIENERSAALVTDDALRFEHSGLCMKDKNTINAEEYCTLGAPGIYAVVKYDPDTTLTLVTAPDGRVGYAAVGPVDFKDRHSRQRFEEISTERARRLEAEERARAKEQAERWEANRRARQAQDAAARKAAAVQREKDLRTKYPSSSFAEAIVSRTVSLGMTPGMVRDAWGNPDDTHRTIIPGMVKEQWVYGSSNYVYFECHGGSCTVTAIQE